MKPIQLASVALLCLFAAATAFAQDTQPAAPATPSAVPATPPAAAATPAAPTVAPAMPDGDATRGHDLVYTCSGCHGIPGYKNAYPHYHVPKIGAQTAQYLTTALVEYRQGKRRHPTMRAQAESFSDQDIADIAAYLSSLAGGAQ